MLPYLQSRSMETRQAAASALGFISRGVGIWDPSSTAPSSALVKAESSLPSVTPDDTLSTAMSLRDLDLTRVLSEGALLLGSSGKEYGKLSALSAEELARAQKDALKNLGLGFGGGDDDIGVDVGAELAAGAAEAPATTVPAASTEPAKPKLPPPRFKPGGGDAVSPAGPSGTASLASSAAPSPAPVASTSAAPSPAAPAAEEDEFAGLSARERNKLKRKRKAEGKAGVAPSAAPTPAAKKARTAAPPPAAPVAAASGSGSSSIKPDPDAPAVQDDKVVVDPAAKAAERARLGGEIQAKEAAERAEFAVKVGEWPWRACVERLALGLLAPAWETRHGAALGLREVLRLQGGGGGMLEGLAREENEERHRRWCEDLAVKLLCVFALDRFGDYISDQVRSPLPPPHTLSLLRNQGVDADPSRRSSHPCARRPLRPSPSSCPTCPLARSTRCSASSSTWCTSAARCARARATASRRAASTPGRCGTRASSGSSTSSPSRATSSEASRPSSPRRRRSRWRTTSSPSSSRRRVSSSRSSTPRSSAFATGTTTCARRPPRRSCPSPTRSSTGSRAR